MHAADVLVLTNTPAGYAVTDGLRHHGASVTSVLLPYPCTTSDAVRMSADTAARSDWAPSVRSVRSVVSLWVSPEVHTAVTGHVIPYLQQDAVWYHLGAGLPPASEGITVRCLPDLLSDDEDSRTAVAQWLATLSVPQLASPPPWSAEDPLWPFLLLS